MIAERFARLAARASAAAGRWWAFTLAALLVLFWVTGLPVFGFSNAIYQLAINTVTTIVTFLMVFLIQNEQNRSSLATQVKLDEIIRALADANNRLIGAEHTTEAELVEAEAELLETAEQETRA